MSSPENNPNPVVESNENRSNVLKGNEESKIEGTGHFFFCQRCGVIPDIKYNEFKNKILIKCPNCNETFPEPNLSLSLDEFIKQIENQTPNLKDCSYCGGEKKAEFFIIPFQSFICKDCLTNPTLEDLDIITSNGFIVKDYCRKHLNENPRCEPMFCLTCKKEKCSLEGGCESHKTVKISEIMNINLSEKVKANIQDTYDKMNKEMIMYQSIISELEKRLKKVKEIYIERKRENENLLKYFCSLLYPFERFFSEKYSDYYAAHNLWNLGPCAMNRIYEVRKEEFKTKIQAMLNNSTKDYILAFSLNHYLENNKLYKPEQNGDFRTYDEIDSPAYQEHINFLELNEKKNLLIGTSYGRLYIYENEKEERAGKKGIKDLNLLLLLKLRKIFLQKLN